MSLAQIAGFILICLMIGIVYLATRFVAQANYQGHGIYYLTINAWFRRHSDYREWLRDNKIYHWVMLLIIALCVTILLLIEPFKQDRVLFRPEASIFINVVLWVAILKTYKWFFDRLHS